jgi:hypothetical protein
VASCIRFSSWVTGLFSSESGMESGSHSLSFFALHSPASSTTWPSGLRTRNPLLNPRSWLGELTTPGEMKANLRFLKRAGTVLLRRAYSAPGKGTNDFACSHLAGRQFELLRFRFPQRFLHIWQIQELLTRDPPCDRPDSGVVRVMALQLSKNLCTKAGTRLAPFIRRLGIIQTNPWNP